MKNSPAKILAIVLLIAAAVAVSTFSAWKIMELKSSGSTAPEPVTAEVTGNNVKNKTEEEKVTQKTPKNVYFSPFTGSDTNSGTEIGSPVETEKKAREIANGLTLSENEEAVILEYLMTVDVRTMQAYGVTSPTSGGINMIPFTGSTEGHWFTGEIQGQGCDTQKYPPEGGAMFSARYLLKGTDCDGKSCSVFIENNGPALELCTPTVVTDSAALADWEKWDLRAIVVPKNGGVDVNVFRIME